MHPTNLCRVLKPWAQVVKSVGSECVSTYSGGLVSTQGFLQGGSRARRSCSAVCVYLGYMVPLSRRLGMGVQYTYSSLVLKQSQTAQRPVILHAQLWGRGAAQPWQRCGGGRSSGTDVLCTWGWGPSTMTTDSQSMQCCF